VLSACVATLAAMRVVNCKIALRSGSPQLLVKLAIEAGCNLEFMSDKFSIALVFTKSDTDLD